MQNNSREVGTSLNHDGLPQIKDNYRKSVTAILLENQERALKKSVTF